MASMTPDQVAAEWASRLGSATTKITAGVQNVNTAPGQLAARQKAVWAQQVVAAQDKWASRTAAVSLPDWQNAMIQKGIPRIASGAQAAQPKMAAFMGQLLPFIDSGRRSLPPRGTLDQNIARMTNWTRHMATFSSKRTGM
jgi:hypothetical protein